MGAAWTASATTAVVLAGGRAQRMEGRDKGLEPFRGQALVEHALERLRQQTAGAPQQIAINANRNLDVYGTWGHPVWPDSLQEFPGPLAGFLTALQTSTTPFVLTVPCDCPLFPLDLLQRLGESIEQSQADIAMVQAPELGPDGTWQLRAQPVFCLMRQSVLPSLQAFIDSGRRKIDTWANAQALIAVPFDRETDDPQAFANANTRAELDWLEKQ